MKHHTPFLLRARAAATLLAAAALLVLASCGTDGSHFRLEGRLLHLNGGEFYVYSPDGEMSGIDTIKIEAGRFTYEMPCTRPQTLMIVFPNYTEQPVFAQPGKSVSIEGDASHLKEMTVKGTADNKLMNTFRQQVASCSPGEALGHARQMMKDHPESMVSAYLLRRFLVQTPTPHIAEARRTVAALVAAQPGNGYLKRLQQRLERQGAVEAGQAVPAVSATATDGTRIDKAWLGSRPTTFVCAWASWNYNSVSQLRQAAMLASQSEGRLQVLGICLDASASEARNILRQQNITCVNVCDGLMTDSPLFRAFGMFDIPDNAVIRQGRVETLHVTGDRINEVLKGK